MNFSNTETSGIFLDKNNEGAKKLMGNQMIKAKFKEEWVSMYNWLLLVCLN